VIKPILEFLKGTCPEPWLENLNLGSGRIHSWDSIWMSHLLFIPVNRLF